MDFLVEMVDETFKSGHLRWTLHVNGASSLKGNGIGVILEKNERS